MQLSKMNAFRGPVAPKAPMLAIAALLSALAGECSAETAYVAQVPANAVANISILNSQQQAQNFGQLPSLRRASLPEITAPAGGGNYASNLQIGARNNVLTLQGGANSISTAGVIGNDNNVAVLQGGNNLKSNVVLLNASHMNVGVIQPRGSAPVNVLIVRLPGGGLLIKR